MKTKNLSVIILLGILYGCIINPIYFEKDLIELPSIVGKWDLISKTNTKKKLTSIWEFSDLSKNEYEINTQRGYFGTFKVKFLKIDEVTYADVVDFWAKPEQQSHYIYRVNLNGDTFRAIPLDIDYLEKGIKSGKFKLSHKIEKDNSSDYNLGETTIITASTLELQKFIIKHQADALLFSPQSEFVLRKIDS